MVFIRRHPAQRAGYRSCRRSQQSRQQSDTHKAGDRVVYAQSALGAYSSVHNVPADKAAILPNAISFEQAAASFLKGLTVFICCVKPMKFSLMSRFVPCGCGRRRDDCLPVGKSIGREADWYRRQCAKAQIALQAGAWQVINYREESIVERVKEITGGKKYGWCMTRWGKIPGSLAGLFTAPGTNGQLW